MTRLGFYLDSRSCTGCKACQIACKDKNDLPVGILWRRVIEVQGGSWLPRGEAWLTNSYAYYLSIACMHCQEPICLEVCPTSALQQRLDGIVFIDDQRCIGCGYCEMACPYKALQMDRERGVMTKCDFCYDLLDQGQPPACVRSCQMRVLHYGDLDQLKEQHGLVDLVYPLPDPALTQPAMIISPHPAAVVLEGLGARIGNREEI